MAWACEDLFNMVNMGTGYSHNWKCSFTLGSSWLFKESAYWIPDKNPNQKK
jgi:hypothetical protein